MPSEKDVLRALAEEARERGAHPDRAAVLDSYLDDQDDRQAPEQAPEQKGRK